MAASRWATISGLSVTFASPAPSSACPPRPTASQPSALSPLPARPSCLLLWWLETAISLAPIAPGTLTPATTPPCELVADTPGGSPPRVPAHASDSSSCAGGMGTATTFRRSTSMLLLMRRSSGESVLRAGSRLTSRSQGLAWASSITSNPNIWKHCLLGAPAATAGMCCRMPSIMLGSTATMILTIKSSTCLQTSVALASPISSTSRRLKAASDHLDPLSSESSLTKLAEFLLSE
mmetsp:Transcript_29696/g.95914  ORF Transcript_29696/g.95914 Transcript_29696/m.95914 type:complete len:236 (-) Transcript_29696:846-1553(-)